MDLSKLKELALGATPGPWESRHHEVVADGSGRVADVSCTRGKYECEKENRDFIAAANPATILDLIALVERQEAELRARAADDDHPVPSAPSASGPLLSGHYAGMILGKSGEPNYNLILLPDLPAGTMNWDDAMAWAVSVGGALPTRREQALLYANLPEQFEPECYWSGDDSAELSDCAWSQDYDSGNQDGCSDKPSKCRARAVIRVPATAKGE